MGKSSRTKPTAPGPTHLQVIHHDDGQNSHLQGFSEDEKKMIRLMASIFVKTVLNLG
jgi:hypothetical protein